MDDDYKKTSQLIVTECQMALEAIDENSVYEYLEMVLSAKRVFFIGVGRVLLALKAIAKRYVHLGIESVIVGETTEPAITAEDMLVVGSGSGETIIPVEITKKAKSFGAKIVHIGSNPNSSLKDIVDLFIRIPVESKVKMSDAICSCQPMTALFEQSLLLFGDTTALLLIQKKQLDLKQLWEFHANLE